MIEDQRHILAQIFQVVCAEKVAGVLISGDVYDRSVPPIEAVDLFGGFLEQLSQEDVPVFLIAGNHDSAQRLAFGREILQKGRVFVSPTFDGRVERHCLESGTESVDIYMLPFIKPVSVAQCFPDKDVPTYTAAVALALEGLPEKNGRPSVLLAHQFVTGAKTCDSEEISVGGSDNVDSTVFQNFDYVALGHLHGPQNIGRDTLRYCGSPLKYSASEVKHEKSVTIVEIGQDVSVKTILLVPLRDMMELRGDYLTLTSPDFYEKIQRDAYIYGVLTDEEEITDGMARLRTVYPNMMKLRYDNQRTRQESQVVSLDSMPELQPIELFSRLYQEQNGAEFTDAQENYLKTVMESIWGQEKEGETT